MYDYLIVTNQPAFYKINLYNEISKNLKIKVIYLGNGSIIRNKDFISGKMSFEYEFLSEYEYENRNKFKNIIKLISIIKSTNYKRILIGGWDELENWVAIFVSSKNKNCVVVESSIFESKVKGLKGLLKKIFLKRINYGYVSGEDQKKVLKALNFDGKIIKTYGVGLMNFQQKKIKILKENNDRKYLYVGRLSEEKNLEFLIEIFNELDYELGIVGSGPEEEYLKKMSNNNIKFYGYVDNKMLPEIYAKYDIFILPSKSEAWGLVIEEALYYGLPVIVSDRVGCRSELVEKYGVGEVFELGKEKELEDRIKNYDCDRYIKNVEKIDFEKIKKKQVRNYQIYKHLYIAHNFSTLLTTSKIIREEEGESSLIIYSSTENQQLKLIGDYIEEKIKLINLTSEFDKIARCKGWFIPKLFENKIKKSNLKRLSFINFYEFEKIFIFNDEAKISRYVIDKIKKYELIQEGMANYLKFEDRNKMLSYLTEKLNFLRVTPKPLGRLSKCASIRYLRGDKKIPNDLKNKSYIKKINTKINESFFYFFDIDKEKILKFDIVILTQPLEVYGYNNDEKYKVYSYIKKSLEREKLKVIFKIHPEEKEMDYKNEDIIGKAPIELIESLNKSIKYISIYSSCNVNGHVNIFDDVELFNTVVKNKNKMLKYIKEYYEN